MKITSNIFEKLADQLIWIFIFLYISIFSYICFLKYTSFGYYDWDFASDVIVYWNSIHGKLLYYPFLEEIIFGAHLYLIIFLLIPIYAIFQHPLTILFLQSLFLGLAVYPLYKLAKLKLNKSFALAISLAYLLYAPLGYINLFETHFDIYAMFFLFFALYYFEKENFKKFLIFIFLAIACKENVALVVFMFGIYAFLRKRTKKWILFPTLLGIIWFFLAIKIVIPYFAKEVKFYQEGLMFSIFYKHLGGNMLDIIKTIIIHPIIIAKYAFTREKILYLFEIFLPTGFIGVLSPLVLLIALPIFLQNLLSSNPTYATIFYHYVALLIPFIFASVVYGFSKLLSYKSIQNRNIVLVGFLIIVIASGIFLEAPQLYFARYIKAYKIDDVAEEKNKLVKTIPQDASVIVSFQFLPKLANRYNLYSMHFVSGGFKMYTKEKYEAPKNLEYAIIDFNEPLLIGSFFPPEAAMNVRSFLENGNWRVLRAVDDIVLFKKDYREGHNLCEVEPNPKIENVVNINIENKIIFLGYNVAKENKKDEGRILHFIYFWKRIAKTEEHLGFFVQFLDLYDKVRFNNLHILGYRIYTPESWPEGEIIKEHHYILIPPEVKKGNYNIRGGLFALEDGRILPVLNKKMTDNLGRIVIP